MIFLPGKAYTDSIISTPLIILPAVICYTLLLIPNLSKDLLLVFKKPSPKSLASILSKPWAASMFWAYAGAFDLFVGRWIYLDAQELDLNHFFVAPILFVSIFFGPIGFLLYVVLKISMQMI